MDLPRQPGPVKITIEADHPEDVYKAQLLVQRITENHYASSTGYTTDDGKRIIICYPFAVND